MNQMLLGFLKIAPLIRHLLGFYGAEVGIYLFNASSRDSWLILSPSLSASFTFSFCSLFILFLFVTSCLQKVFAVSHFFYPFFSPPFFSSATCSLVSA